MQKIDPDHIIALVTEVIPTHSCLVFCPTKKNCENVAVMICKYLKEWVDLLQTLWRFCLSPPSIINNIFWILTLFSLFLLCQGVYKAPRGQESGPPQGANGQRQRLRVSGAQEDGAVRFGLSPQWADLRGEETGGGGLLQWGPLSAHLHLHPSGRCQPPSSQVSHSLHEVLECISSCHLATQPGLIHQQLAFNSSCRTTFQIHSSHNDVEVT